MEGKQGSNAAMTMSNNEPQEALTDEEIVGLYKLGIKRCRDFLLGLHDEDIKHPALELGVLVMLFSDIYGTQDEQGADRFIQSAIQAAKAELQAEQGNEDD